MPNHDRVECMKFLQNMNITRASLYPDLDGAANYLKALWDMQFESRRGTLRPVPQR